MICSRVSAIHASGLQPSARPTCIVAHSLIVIASLSICVRCRAPIRLLRLHQASYHPSSYTVASSVIPPTFASLVLPYRCIIRPPTPLHHLHHLGSILPPFCIIWAQSCLRSQPVALRQFFPQAMAVAKLPPSCRQAAAKSFRAIAVSASSAAARPSGSVAGSRSRWAAWRAPAQPTPCCPPLTHVPGGPFAHSGAPGLPPRPRT